MLLNPFVSKIHVLTRDSYPIKPLGAPTCHYLCLHSWSLAQNMSPMPKQSHRNSFPCLRHGCPWTSHTSKRSPSFVLRKTLEWDLHSRVRQEITWDSAEPVRPEEFSTALWLCFCRYMLFSCSWPFPVSPWQLPVVSLGSAEGWASASSHPGLSQVLSEWLEGKRKDRREGTRERRKGERNKGGKDENFPPLWCRTCVSSINRQYKMMQ